MQHTSLPAMLRTNCKRFADRPAFILPGKSNAETITYAAFWNTLRRYAAVLRAWGIKPGERIVILGENCIDWFSIDYAAKTLGGISCAIYPTLPADQAQVIAKDCQARLALCSSPDQAAKLEGIHGLVVRTFRGPDSIAEAAQFATLDDEEWNASIDAVKPEDITTFIYTSGTTGQPKGAMLTHAAFLTVCAAAGPYLEINERDRFFSILPISHVFERIASTLAFHQGSALGLNKSISSLASDFIAIKPTFMAAVPRFLEAFQDKIESAISEAPALRRKLFRLYILQGVKRAKGKFAPLYGLLDKWVGSKIRARMGGALTRVISGGAALPAHTAEFYMALNIHILQGYGLTETTGGSCCNHPTRNKYWTVGEPLGVELKLAPDGEICFRGPSVMKGYFNRPEATAEVMDADGWFHTGDIGEMEGASLKITDRKKDILVLGNGKNVAPQPIENKIKASRYINEAVVLGDGMEHCIALIVPNAELIRSELGLPDSAPLAGNASVKALLKREIDGVNKQNANFEAVKKWALIDEAFTVESGLLTPTLKVKRKAVKERFASEIDALTR